MDYSAPLVQLAPVSMVDIEWFEESKTWQA